MSDYPIRLVVTDDRRRNRLTVFFRLLLLIPHFIWLFLWGIAVAVVAVINWFATLIVGTSPRALHNFLATFLRYGTHVSAYLTLLADEYPEFTGEPGYAIDLEIDPPEPQPRWQTFLRPILAFPASTLSSTLTGEGGRRAGALGIVAFFGWFVSLAKGEMPRGMRDLGAYTIGYGAQSLGYLLLLTSRYPNSDPSKIGSPAPLPEHPVTMSVSDDLVRSRLTVFFRWLLAIPHFFWIFLWGVAALVAVVVNWFATLFMGRSPAGLHRFISAFVSYQTHVLAYVTIVANRFPGFAGEAYDIDVEIAAPERQNRWITAFRAILAIPAQAIMAGLFNALFVVAVFGWFASLVLGRMPQGLRNLGAYCLRYNAQVNAYTLVLTDRYPYSGPPAESSAAVDPNEPASAELGAALAA